MCTSCVHVNFIFPINALLEYVVCMTSGCVKTMHLCTIDMYAVRRKSMVESTCILIHKRVVAYVWALKMPETTMIRLHSAFLIFETDPLPFTHSHSNSHPHSYQHEG